MWPNPQFAADLVTFTEEIIIGKFYFMCSVETRLCCDQTSQSTKKYLEQIICANSSSKIEVCET